MLCYLLVVAGPIQGPDWLEATNCNSHLHGSQHRQEKYAVTVIDRAQLRAHARSQGAVHNRKEANDTQLCDMCCAVL